MLLTVNFMTNHICSRDSSVRIICKTETKKRNRKGKWDCGIVATILSCELNVCNRHYMRYCAKKGFNRYISLCANKLALELKIDPMTITDDNIEERLGMSPVFHTVKPKSRAAKRRFDSMSEEEQAREQKRLKIEHVQVQVPTLDEYIKKQELEQSILTDVDSVRKMVNMLECVVDPRFLIEVISSDIDTLEKKIRELSEVTNLF